MRQGQPILSSPQHGDPFYPGGSQPTALPDPGQESGAGLVGSSGPSPGPGGSRGCMGLFLPASQCVFLLRCWVLMPASGERQYVALFLFSNI